MHVQYIRYAVCIYSWTPQSSSRNIGTKNHAGSNHKHVPSQTSDLPHWYQHPYINRVYIVWPTITVLMLQKSRIASDPPSLPNPDSFTPPNGLPVSTPSPLCTALTWLAEK